MRSHSVLIACSLASLLLSAGPAGAKGSGKQSQKGGLPAVSEAVAQLAPDVAALSAQVAALTARVQALEAILQYVTVVPGPIEGLAGPHWIIEGANVHVRSGSGATDDGGSPTGLGNLVIGYNERFNPRPRGGSHNLIVGPDHGYSSTGGAVVGLSNEVRAQGAAVTGGFANVASGTWSSVSGGDSNEATTSRAWVGGGIDNVASGFLSAVSGGERNEASGQTASICGGRENTASGDASVVGGGFGNEASGGGASVSGGFGRTAPAANNWAAGSLLEPN